VGRELSGDEIAARYGPLRTAVTGCTDHAVADDLNRMALVHGVDCGGHDACDCEMP